MAHHRRLVLLCVKALSTFNAQLDGVDTHLKSFLALPECNLTDEADVTFVSEVLAGCVQFHQLIKAIVGGYYLGDGKTCLRADSNLYSVVAYLLLFRLEELGMGHLKKLIGTQHIGKMHKFLKFFLDNLKGWIRDEACKLYDRHFLETSILSSVLNYELELQEFLHELSDKLSGNDCSIRKIRPVTDTKPFSLTKPRPRSVPTPEKIPVLKASRPVPKSTYTKPAEEDQLTRAREKNRRKAEDILREAERSKFSCATAEKSEKTKAILAQIEEERNAKLQYEPVKPAFPLASLKEKRPVKLNAAAILREGARVLKEEEEEERKLSSLEAGQKDDADFVKWQEEMKQASCMWCVVMCVCAHVQYVYRGIAAAMAAIERKHLEGQLSYEEAIIAKQKYLQGNREKVQSMKEEMDSLMDQYYSQLEEEQREMRALVEGVMEGHQSSKEAKQRIQETKHAIAQQMNKESQELLARAFEQAEADMRQKAELIQQIKAMESVPIIRAKFVDTTETGGQGLLAEMSLAELKERLSLMRIAEEEEEERKRKEILAAKQTKELMLSEALNMISLHRLEQSKQQAAKKEQLQQTLKEYVELNDTKLTALQQKLEDRRKEREKLKQIVTPTRQELARRDSECSSVQPGGKRGKLTPASPKASPLTALLKSATRVE
ncbi:hypothetical protein EMCRGX_G028929 [Ephydatia muelleri]